MGFRKKFMCVLKKGGRGVVFWFFLLRVFVVIISGFYSILESNNLLLNSFGYDIFNGVSLNFV